MISCHKGGERWFRERVWLWVFCFLEEGEGVCILSLKCGDRWFGEQVWPWVWTQGVLESPPSFCNGLGIICIASFQVRTIDLTTKDMGWEFRYILGKVLGTQDSLTLRLVFHHCILYLNLIKNMFNTWIYTQTHTSIHQSIQYGIIIPKHIPI